MKPALQVRRAGLTPLWAGPQVHLAQSLPMAIRRRQGEGTVHPVILNGRVASWRGLASYQDPETGTRHRRSVSGKTREQAERALRRLICSFPKARYRRARTATEAVWTVTGGPDSLSAYLGRWLEHKRRDGGPPPTGCT